MDSVKTSEGRRKAAPVVAVDGALRRPLVPSEKNNADPAPAGRRREVPSRVKPGVPPPQAAANSAARRCASPCPARASAVEGTAPPPKRAQSAERRRPSTLSSPSPATARSTTPVRDAAASTEVHATSRRATSAKLKPPDGLWASARNLSPSFQSESVAAPAKNRDRPLSTSSLNHGKVNASAVADSKRSPLRGRNTGSNQCENARPSETPTRRTVEQQHRWPAMMAGRPLPPSNPPRGHSPRRTPPSECAGNAANQPINEMAKRLAMYGGRREEDKAESASGSDASSQTPEFRALRSTSSPTKVLSAASSTSRAFQSPSRMRPSIPGPSQSQCASTGQSGAAPAQPVFNYMLDARKRKKNASQVENIHHLRLLYNRYLQWHFVNARSEDTVSFQKNSVESILYSVWKSILKLRDAVTVRRIDVQHLRQELKLYNILKEQIAYLQKWPALEEGNSSILAGAIEVLKASTLRLPVTSGAQVDDVAVKNAISSAVDVMQALNSSICYLLLKVEDRARLFSELSVMARQEKATLDECRELLATAAKLQVQESSLGTHLMQLREGFVG